MIQWFKKPTPTIKHKYYTIDKNLHYSGNWFAKQLDAISFWFGREKIIEIEVEIKKVKVVYDPDIYK